jgi:hypothetical protein
MMKQPGECIACQQQADLALVDACEHQPIDRQGIVFRFANDHPLMWR